MNAQKVIVSLAKPLDRFLWRYYGIYYRAYYRLLWSVLWKYYGSTIAYHGQYYGCPMDSTIVYYRVLWRVLLHSTVDYE